MKRITAVVLGALMCASLVGCGNSERAALPDGFGGVYITDSTYGMEDFKSEIEFELDDMEFDYEVEHFDEDVESDEGKFSFKDNIVTLKGKNGTKEFVYSPTDKTLYNEEMDTVWTHSSVYFQKLKDEIVNDGKHAPAAESPEYFGTYKYSNEAVDAEMVIDEKGFTLSAVSKGDNDTFETSGNVAFVNGSLVFTDDDKPVVCAFDAAVGTINYDSMIFTRE